MKAANDLKDLREDMQIHKVNWAPNSPDLNTIEPVWGYIKDSLVEYRIRGSSKAACDVLNRLFD